MLIARDNPVLYYNELGEKIKHCFLAIGLSFARVDSKCQFIGDHQIDSFLNKAGGVEKYWIMYVVRTFGRHRADRKGVNSQSREIILLPVDYQAGVTAILEAMAMSKAVICTLTPGQTDVIVDGENGLYVDPSDPNSMRSAIRWLLDHPREADHMGRNGRQLVEQEMSLEHYVRRLARSIESIIPDENIQ